MFTDRVRIKNFTTDHNNVRTETDVYESEAYVEDYSREVRTFDGTPVMADFLIMLPSKRSVFAGSTLEILKLHGTVPVGNETGEYHIKAVNRIGARRLSHLEVVV